VQQNGHQCECIDLVKKIVVEHTRCGCVEYKEAFKTGDGYSCPECCIEALSSDEIRKIATVSECQLCGDLIFNKDSLRGSPQELTHKTTEDLLTTAQRDARERTLTYTKQLHDLFRSNILMPFRK
jgi:hypothetical protein